LYKPLRLIAGHGKVVFYYLGNSQWIQDRAINDHWWSCYESPRIPSKFTSGTDRFRKSENLMN